MGEPRHCLTVKANGRCARGYFDFVEDAGAADSAAGLGLARLENLVRRLETVDRRTHDPAGIAGPFAEGVEAGVTEGLSGVVAENPQRRRGPGLDTDQESAKAALPKLTEMNLRLDEIVAKVAKLSPESKDSFAGVVMNAESALEGAMTMLRAKPGVSETLKPVMDSFMSKVKSLM
jgi:hypothetical protein